MDIKLTNSDYVAGIIQIFKDKKIYGIRFEENTYADQNDIPLSKTFGLPIKLIALSPADPDCIRIIVSRGTDRGGNFIDCDGHEALEDFPRIFEEIYRYTQKAEAPEPEDWLEEYLLRKALWEENQVHILFYTRKAKGEEPIVRRVRAVAQSKKNLMSLLRREANLTLQLDPLNEVCQYTKVLDCTGNPVSVFPDEYVSYFRMQETEEDPGDTLIEYTIEEHECL